MANGDCVRLWTRPWSWLRRGVDRVRPAAQPVRSGIDFVQLRRGTGPNQRGRHRVPCRWAVVWFAYLVSPANCRSRLRTDRAGRVVLDLGTNTGMSEESG